MVWLDFWDEVMFLLSASDSEPLISTSSSVCITWRLTAAAIEVLFLSTHKVGTVLVASLLDIGGSRCVNDSVFCLPAGTRARLRAVQEEATLRLLLFEGRSAQRRPLHRELKGSEAVAYFLAPQHRLGSRAQVERRQVRFSFGRWGSGLEHKRNDTLWKGF